MDIQKVKCNQNVNFGKVGRCDDGKGFPPAYVKDAGKEVLDGLHKAGEGLRAMIHKPGVLSSAPNITNAQTEITEEENRLKSRPLETVQHLEERGFKPKVNSDGLFTTCGIPYSGVIQNQRKELVEYKDGKPVTIIKNVSNGNHIVQKIVRFEYPEGSIAALKTETSILQETNYEKGNISYKVPPAIREEAGIV